MQILKPLFLLFLLCLLQPIGYAQESLDELVPLDEKVRTGQLENGLEYYIQYNPKPENKLELRLAIKAGAMQENDNQLGLAHFLEHMAFNGSEHFEKNDLISYLQSIGVAFGSDLNAYTSFDETVYMLPIPTDEEEKLNNGFQVMRDWAGGLLLASDDIEAERGIVVEEWRTGQGVNQRLRDAYLPVLLHQSRYADRMPIGEMDIIRNAADSLVRQFYQDWYRPDLMAVVAVGDVDPDKVEELIKSYFSDLKNPLNARKREYYNVPTHKENFVKIITDEEAPGIQVQLYYKQDARPSNSYKDYKGRILRTMFGGMITQRLDEIRQKPDAPFIFAGARYGNLVRPLDFFTISGVVGPGKLKDGFLAFLTENQRVVDYGFTQSELDRVKRSLLNSSEKSFKEMDKVESRTLVGRYVSHFLNNSFADGPESRYDFYQDIIPKITLEEVNDIARELIRKENIVLIVTAPEKDKETLTPEAELLALLENADAIETTPYKEDLVREELMLTKPKSGEVVNVSHDEEVDVTTVLLGNGMKVYFKPTDFKNDEIIFSASSEGGTSLYSLEDHYSANYAGSAINIMGIGDFTPSQLKKVLAGKNVQVTPNISTYSESISGATTPGDFEMALQLIHLYFTSPRMDKSLWEVFLANQKNQLESASVNPDFQFNKRVNEIISNGNPRGKGIYTAGQLDSIDLSKSLKIYKERFANAGDFNVLFTGNIDREKMLPLVAQYLGSLPGDSTGKEDFIDLGLTPPQDRKENIKVGVDDKSQVILYFSGETAYDLEKSQQLSYLGEILTIKLIETLREEIGGVYGVGARGSLSRVPEERFNFSISFPCGPESVDKLKAAVWEQIQKIQEEGPDEADLEKVRETKRLDLEENLKRNGFWHGQLNAAINGGLPLNTVLGAEGRVLGVTATEVKQVANEFLQKPYLLEITRYPANFEE
ncbi:M16 family metallopeptidase [Cyclobacterium qasimii]|uniref:Peptidase M16 n=2 Tax=Cyclobacterium qasimii TaxID=1350429 RepID=A0A512C5Z9_9BACT|nr:insulinase family protein [Cyclobacterium qasimii]EPR65501.1 putative zinc protease pqqL [Cyclobacterium qasimii M12-11B]GEO19635.1 peptidase M16 [Cyclobacterium qasimii]